MRHFIQNTAMVTTAIALLPSPASALDIDSRVAIDNLRGRIEKPEANRAESRDNFVLTALDKMLTIYGNVEVEGSYLNTKGAAKESNLALATARVGLQLDIAENIGGRLVFLHEEGEDETVKIDEANIVISWPQIGGGVLQAIGGRIYLPFGSYSSNFISDPLTLELGEIDKTAVLIGWRNNLVDFNCAIFNGDRPVDDNIEEFVASLTAQPAKGVSIGISYLSDLAETDIDLAHLTGPASTTYDSEVESISAFLTLEVNSFTFVAEYITALDDFEPVVVNRSVELTGPKPNAITLELSYLVSSQWQVAARYEAANDFQDDPRRWGMFISYGLFENAALGLEYLCRDTAPAIDNSSHMVTARLAVAF